MTLNKQLDYQTSFVLPVDTARKYQYGLTNNIINSASYSDFVVKYDNK